MGLSLRIRTSPKLEELYPKGCTPSLKDKCGWFFKRWAKIYYQAGECLGSSQAHLFSLLSINGWISKSLLWNYRDSEKPHESPTNQLKLQDQCDNSQAYLEAVWTSSHFTYLPSNASGLLLFHPTESHWRLYSKRTLWEMFIPLRVS